MAKSSSWRGRIWLVLGVVLVVLAFLGVRYWRARQSAVPAGIAWGNGRIEARLVDASAKEPLRVKEVLVNEGDLVKPGQVLARLDVSTLESQLAEARARVAAAQEQLAVAKAAISRRRSEIALAKIEADRSRALVAERAGSQRESDVRQTTLETTQAALQEEQARLASARQQVEVARADEKTIQTRIADATLTSPIVGRVLYRLAEPGEVLAPGGKALTLVNLEDVYMEIFLPTEQVGGVKIGSDARITVDHEPGRAAPGVVTFVSPEAQFTPKEVETRSEREKLMFRVKIQIPRDLVMHYVESVKTGVRGVGYVKVDDRAVWPSWLQQNVVRSEAAGATERAGAADSASTKKSGGDGS